MCLRVTLPPFMEALVERESWTGPIPVHNISEVWTHSTTIFYFCQPLLYKIEKICRIHDAYINTTTVYTYTHQEIAYFRQKITKRNKFCKHYT